MDLELEKAIAALKLDKVQRHIFLCAQPTEAKCCDPAEGARSWDFLKRRLKELGLGGNGEKVVLRTKADCLRVCMRGPVAVVYPEGTWYHSCTEEVLEEIIQEHLIHGRIVKKYAFARNPNFSREQDDS